MPLLCVSLLCDVLLGRMLWLDGLELSSRTQVSYRCMMLGAERMIGDKLKFQ